MNNIRGQFAALLFACFVVVTPAGATAFTTDQSDLWYVSSENGWGMQLVQRGSVIFATLFVYDTFHIPIWYTATLSYQGNLIWSGDLQLTSGPWFGTVPFNPATVTIRRVGTMTWNGQFVEVGSVVYSVDGVVVTKPNLVRQTLVLDDSSGSFLGALHGVATGCSNPANNVTGEAYGVTNVVQSGQSFSAQFAAQNGSGCSYTGILTQFGQFGHVQGTYSCTGGEVGNFTFFETNSQINQWSTRFTLSSTNIGCSTSGYMGGIRHRP